LRQRVSSHFQEYWEIGRVACAIDFDSSVLDAAALAEGHARHKRKP
jgi:hypothetical protein